ncbi:PEP-CTERM system TPR-repeat protein PrsT [Roseomonas sp. KE2513]|uniref:XrtA/PEP-CTERM system TPR-repeat protein PrsT n=1 Tax=Roseomonas sp. KE2513 TaxID=2479202 RepID=UPI0018DF134A|nr:XrtA/PEP-CTERM system TPR-repeat protein PrsT [Roseomonas sp. KE2513]MBI0537611.1 PEP-CTERM system TPR-repeat protein PrsT [Roseomonas sp. KE2513]
MTRRTALPRPLAMALVAGLSVAAVAPAVAQPLERARAAQAKGDLRTAQIELRNAVRDDPRSPVARMALVQASLDVGDGATAEKEARTALELGADQVQATSALLRAYLVQNRNNELLRDFPPQPDKPALGAQIAAARALAQLSLNRQDDAAASVAEALKLNPNAPEPHTAAAALALVKGDRAEAEAEADRALAADPNSIEALLRKGTLQMARGAVREGAETVGRVLALAPGNIPARLARAEALMAAGDNAGARRDVDAALASQPGSAAAVYLRASLFARSGDWRAADDDLQRIQPVLANFPEGFLIQALVKRALNQTAQAEDSARRYVARRPEDVRGVKLLAGLEMEAQRPDAAAGTVTRYLSRLGPQGQADADTYDLLGRAHAAARRPREAAEALTRAAALSPQDTGILNRLAAARLTAGDARGAADAAQKSLAVQSDQPTVRELLATASMLGGNMGAASAQLQQLGEEGRRGEAAGVTEGTLKLTKLDLAGARASYEAVLRDHPDSIGARLGLARVANSTGRPEEAEKLLGEVLRRAPTNADALAQLGAAARPGSPRAVPARAVLESVQAAAPGELAPALALAEVLVRSNEPAKALELLDSQALRANGRNRGPLLPMARSEALAAAGRMDEAREAARSALAEDPTSIDARIRLAALTSRSGDARGAESVIQEGLRNTPADLRLQQAYVALVKQARGLDAALAQADRLASQTSALPAAAALRGDLLAGENRMEEAARAYAAANEKTPNPGLVLRQSAALRSAGKLPEASAPLRALLARQPDDISALMALASLDIMQRRYTEAEAGLAKVVERSPNDAVALNNLAWLVDRRGATAQAREMAERAYALSQNPDTADTLGWILTRAGEPRLGVALLRQSVAARAAAGAPDPAVSWRLAYALRQAGDRDEALRVLTPALATPAAFDGRPEAERLLADLKAGR